MSIARWKNKILTDFLDGAYLGHWMQMDDKGDYVLHTDHAAEVERLMRLLSMAQASEDELATNLGRMGKRVRVLESRLASAYGVALELPCECTGHDQRCEKHRILAATMPDAALAKPQSCKTCGGTGWKKLQRGCRETNFPNERCPNCQPQQKENG